ncbi:2OG-FeII-Oxy-2 domain-containing protein [Mycena venus]|uniref:2OG-FeII-Oxy-2 domain-containing protein n=1 Tax=Mycena venus TaxID=2733690 RepID=A0A8H6Y837_9AGAR|nr:2OG-FeII-Oxy-2 domain-containing protein [Mycena venus]
MLKRAIGTFQRLPHPDFTFLPGFFSLAEQRVLLTTALRKLDAMESIQSRRRRKALLQTGLPTLPPTASNPLQDCFLHNDCYEFEEGHYDGVIKLYREMHLTSWPSDVPELSPILERLHSLFPPQDIQTHLLHLASNGEILPHIDNLSASGSWILGVSLGAERLLLLEPKNGNGDSFQVLLPSGSVYIQRDSLRYDYKHSILVGGTYEGRELRGGERVSIMIRDRLPDSVSTV